MKAKLTNRHTLHLAMSSASASVGKVTPQDPQWVPGTWGCWMLDDKGKLVPKSQFEVGFGEFSETYKWKAYELSVALLEGLRATDGLVAFENLEWI